MDLATLFGFLLGFGLIGWAMVEAAGDQAKVFASLHATLIVGGGAIASVLISFPLRVFLRMGKIVKVLWMHKEQSIAVLIDDLVRYAEIARRDGILSLENVTKDMKDPFIVKGIQMAVDGTDPEVIEQIMQSELEAIAERHTQGKAMFEAMGKYAPAYGLIGTLIGLVIMLMNLNDPSKIGPGMALGLIGTLYGTAMANMIALPLSEKLVQRNNEEIMLKSIIIKGVISIQSGDNPRIVEHRLKTFLPAAQRKASELAPEEKK
jgi:chemotaxis protein MotA